MKFGVWCPLVWQKASNPRKFSPRKSNYYQFAKVFSLESFPLYSITKQEQLNTMKDFVYQGQQGAGNETHLRKELWSNQL